MIKFRVYLLIDKKGYLSLTPRKLSMSLVKVNKRGYYDKNNLNCTSTSMLYAVFML